MEQKPGKTFALCQAFASFLKEKEETSIKITTIRLLVHCLWFPEEGTLDKEVRDSV